MKKRFLEEQIIGVLKEAEAGLKVADLCRKHGISDVTFYKWRSKYGWLEISEARRRRKRPSHLRVIRPGPTGPDQRWSLDFMSDALVNGRRLRLLTMVDGWDRSCPHIEVDHSLAGERVVRVLERLKQ